MRAYDLFVDRGCEHGRHLEDWLAAECAAAEPVLAARTGAGHLSACHFPGAANVAARDITAKTRAAMPTMPFIPGPETLNIAMLLRLKMPLTGKSS